MPECAYDDCSEPAWPQSSDAFCIYHSPDNSKDNATAREVWQEARSRAENPQGCDFRGWHFPNDPDGQWFISAVFKDKAVFTGATFGETVNFSKAKFQGAAEFSECTFNGTAIFFRSIFKYPVTFLRAKFHKDADFSSGRCLDAVDFCEVIFHGAVLFSDAIFSGSSKFSQTRFQGNAIFSRAVCGQGVDFSSADFHSQALFNGVNFLGNVDLFGVCLLDRTIVKLDLPAWELPFGKHTPFAKRDQGELLYRLAKESARRQGDYSMAGKYYYAEQCAIEYGNRKKSRCKLWHFLAEWLFARNIFGYGEKPHRALIAGGVLITLCAALYLLCGAIGPSGLEAAELAKYQPSIGDSAYFSVVSFTTLGYGDLVPKPGYRWLASIEAAYGSTRPSFVTVTSRLSPASSISTAIELP